MIYEHAATTLPGRKLARELAAMLEAIRKEGARVFDHEGAVTLRAIEAGAQEAARQGAGERGYLELMRRLIETVPAQASEGPGEPAPASQLILP